MFHQVVFAFLMLAATVRTRYLRQSIKGRISPNNRSILAKQYALGFGLFALGFVIWNVDNIYCGEISSLKRRIGWPSAFLLEGTSSCSFVSKLLNDTNLKGHAWWHIFTVRSYSLSSLWPDHISSLRAMVPTSCSVLKLVSFPLVSYNTLTEGLLSADLSVFPSIICSPANTFQ